MIQLSELNSDSELSPAQTPSTADDRTRNKPYVISAARDIRRWKRGVEEKKYSVKFDKSKAGKLIFYLIFWVSIYLLNCSCKQSF